MQDGRDDLYISHWNFDDALFVGGSDGRLHFSQWVKKKEDMTDPNMFRNDTSYDMTMTFENTMGLLAHRPSKTY